MKSQLYEASDALRRGLTPRPKNPRPREEYDLMTRTLSTSIQPALAELLRIDRSLSSTQAKALEWFLLDPRPSTVREVSRATHAPQQGLYSALDALVARGLVERDATGPSMRFRAANPRVVLHELLAPYLRMRDLVEELEEPLRGLHAPGSPEPATGDPSPTSLTRSGAAASGWLVDRLAAATREVWFLGNETPWFGRSTAVESELRDRSRRTSPLGVRLLVPPAELDDPRLRHHGRLRSSGAEVRYSTKFSTPAVIVDRRWILMLSGTDLARSGGTGSYVRLDTPELCEGLAREADQEWTRTGAPGKGDPSASNGSPGRSGAAEHAPRGRNGRS